ncbi:MAG: hypothetical protein MUE40_07805 [Anaerolineae bacterium]|nr:hypothetical protein [Anaerolineae bacterium]
MTLRLIPALLAALLLATTLHAQPRNISDLVALETQVITQTDAFGVAQQVLVGTLRNTGTQAYADIQLYVDVLDADGNVAGEGFGFLVDACGSAVLDSPLQPQQQRGFAATLDIFAPGTVIGENVVYADGTAVAPEVLDLPPLTGMTAISTQEVVEVVWESADTLRYGVGCPRRVFSTYAWYRHRVGDNASTPIPTPNADALTETFIAQSAINVVTQNRTLDTTLFDRSMLTFAPDGQQAVFQSDIHSLFTIRRDGAFRRGVHIFLHQYTLQGINWTPRNNFLAYYFGAYGEPVRYVTGTGAGRLISQVITAAVPSVIVPGTTYNGDRAFIAGTFPVDGADVTGYFVRDVRRNSAPELLFAADELPGNNYPAPAYYLREADDTRSLYIVRPVDGQPTLQCYAIEAQSLHTLTALPLQLATDERAWSWIAPDGGTLALSASGDHAGLWLIDLRAFDVCAHG